MINILFQRDDCPDDNEADYRLGNHFVMSYEPGVCVFMLKTESLENPMTKFRESIENEVLYSF